MSHATRDGLVVAWLALACVAGCASHQEGYSEIRARAAASAPKRTLSPEPGKLSFENVPGDPAEPLPPESLAREGELDLARLREQVLASNPSLAAMHATWQAAIARHPQARAFDDPEIFYGIAPGTIGAEGLDFGQKVELRQRLPWPGRLRLRGDATLAEAQAVGEDFQATRLALLELTDESFFEYYFMERAIEINRVNQELLVDLEHIARARYSAGLVHKQDALAAEVESHHLIHRGIVLTRARAVAVARINTLLDRAPDAPLPPAPSRLASVTPVPERPRLEEYALAHRPELDAWAFRLRASESEIALARREYFPDLTVMGGYDTLMEAEERRGMVGVGFELPLQIGRRRAAVGEAEAKRLRARAELARERAAVLFEVSSALDGLEESAHVVHLYATSFVPAAEENLDAARSGYESGRNDFLTLVSAEKTLMLARLSYEEAVSQYHQRRAELERALGGSLASVEEMK